MDEKTSRVKMLNALGIFGSEFKLDDSIDPILTGLDQELTETQKTIVEKELLDEINEMAKPPYYLDHNPVDNQRLFLFAADTHRRKFFAPSRILQSEFDGSKSVEFELTRQFWKMVSKVLIPALVAIIVTLVTLGNNLSYEISWIWIGFIGILIIVSLIITYFLLKFDYTKGTELNIYRFVDKYVNGWILEYRKDDWMHQTFEEFD